MAMFCGSRPPSALARFAASLRVADAREEDHELEFPMYTVPVSEFFCMTEVAPHEQLLEAGILTRFTEDMGRAIFVSHQWVGQTNPDPGFRQMRTLQQALRNLLSGVRSVQLSVIAELAGGQSAGYSTRDFNKKPLFLWYDYFSCPQADVGSDITASQSLQRAVSSIPSYVQRCHFFMILCPVLQSLEEDKVLNYASWSQRAWCRAESVARELCLSRDNLMIRVDSAQQMTLLPTLDKIAPGDGVFTYDVDRARVAKILQTLVRKKLLYHLKQGDFHGYRTLWNQQTRIFRYLPADYIQDLVPSCDTFSAPCADGLNKFLHQNGFRHALERDEATFSPICYAALHGQPKIMAALLALRADPNDKVFRKSPSLGSVRHSSIVQLCAFLHHNDCVRLLISCRANVNAQDTNGSSPLHLACATDNVDGIRAILSAGGDLNLKAFPGLTPFQYACGAASVNAMKELLKDVYVPGEQFILHMMLTTQRATVDSVALLLRARADINERFCPAKGSAIWNVQKVLLLKHMLRPTMWTTVASNHWNASPLMVSIVAGLYDVSAFLIAAGAEKGVRNWRGKTALMLAEETLAPEFLVSALQGAEEEPLHHSFFRWPSDNDTFSI